MQTHPPKHLFLTAVHMWGHARPLIVCAARMVRLRPVVITFCIASKLYEKAKAEIASDYVSENKEPLQRLRLIQIDQGPNTLDPEMYKDNFMAVWHKLCSGESVACQSADGATQSVNLQSEPLSGILVDGFAIEVLNALYKQRDSSPAHTNLNIFNWIPVSSNHIVALYRQDPIPLAVAIAEREGISFDDAAYKLLAVAKGRVIECPGLPPMYDYEHQPQGFTFPQEMLGRVFIRLAGGMMQADALVTLDAADYHPEATAACREYLGVLGRKVHFAGPLITKTHPAPDPEVAAAAEAAMQFMDKQLKKHGERSLIYVSFGSLFWPMDPAKLVAVLDILMQQGIPFVLPHPSPLAHLPDELMQRLKEYPDVYMANWVPQQAILDHPATGWCLTHGGHNSVLECIHSGVPMIVWPITADQPANAVHLTDNLDVAYELLEVRNGTGAGPICRTGQKPVATVDSVRAELRDVLARAFGEDGAAKRARLLALREKLDSAWTEEGVARREVEAFLDYVGTLPTFSLVRNA
ncbi:glycosyltransferase family 1 protein [Trametes sanguinea]|nr:glycosyltransferase family 1 protein [Trametes sanguinea]